MKNLAELKVSDAKMDFKTAKKFFKLLPTTMKLQVFINSGSYTKCDAIDIQAMKINATQALCFLEGIDADCEVKVITYDSSFDFALAYNAATQTETEKEEPIQQSYTQEQEDAMYGESHFIQMLEATKDLF